MTATPHTAARTIALLAHHRDDIGAAIYDIQTGLRSLGSYTDRSSEAVLDLLRWLQARDQKFPDTMRLRRAQMADIAAKQGMQR